MTRDEFLSALGSRGHAWFFDTQLVWVPGLIAFGFWLATLVLYLLRFRNLEDEQRKSYGKHITWAATVELLIFYGIALWAAWRPQSLLALTGQSSLYQFSPHGVTLVIQSVRTGFYLIWISSLTVPLAFALLLKKWPGWAPRCDEQPEAVVGPEAVAPVAAEPAADAEDQLRVEIKCEGASQARAEASEEVPVDGGAIAEMAQALEAVAQPEKQLEVVAKAEDEMSVVAETVPEVDELVAFTVQVTSEEAEETKPAEQKLMIKGEARGDAQPKPAWLLHLRFHGTTRPPVSRQRNKAHSKTKRKGIPQGRQRLYELRG